METSRLTGSTILGADFYNQMVHDLARALLGKVIVRQMDDGVLVKGRIVETEGNHQSLGFGLSSCFRSIDCSID